MISSNIFNQKQNSLFEEFLQIHDIGSFELRSPLEESKCVFKFTALQPFRHKEKRIIWIDLF